MAQKAVANALDAVDPSVRMRGFIENESKIFPDFRKSHLWVRVTGEPDSFPNESALAYFGHPIGNLAYFLQLDDWWAEKPWQCSGLPLMACQTRKHLSKFRKTSVNR